MSFVITDLKTQLNQTNQKLETTLSLLKEKDDEMEILKNMYLQGQEKQRQEEKIRM